MGIGGIGRLGRLGRPAPGKGVGGPSNNLFALVGDSRPAADHANSTGTTIYHNVTGIGWWVQNLTGGRVRFKASDDFAVGGSTTEDMNAGPVASAIASSAASVVLLSSTNDQAANNWAASRSIAALTTAINALLNAGKWLYVVAELPRGSSGFTAQRYTTQQEIDHGLVRAFLLGLANSHPRIKVIDAYPTISDTGGVTTDYLAAQTYDGVHPSAFGAYTIASVIAPIVLQRHAADSYAFNASDVYNASTNPFGNLLPNGAMAGTSGSLTSGVTGSLADNTSASTGTFTGLSAVCSKVTTGTGNWQQVVVSGTSGAGTPILAFTQSVNYSNLSVNDKLEARGEWEVDAGSVGFKAPAFSLGRFNTGVSKGFSRSGANASIPWPTGATSGKWRSPSQVTILGDENQVQGNTQLYIAPSTTVAFTFRFKNLDIRKAL